ncbi:sugar ABC transporter ATP-binding protein [Fodinisporobacter ferrooxydans]|uniref:Sugar ABC transporter ATP-binding protein n=1 Tax=Fodinisporobacter ferrooxydans TaxID=2901836 RepID=A0ABY4CLD6_9BACL|nr:sugar ABC transporter ATP-binding protein [Alicyclobacillaceae bacterium MYW30-H2]
MSGILQLEHINKSFSGVSVLKNMRLTIVPGEVHALLGENGAGKSTLMKILTGVYVADTGTIAIDGQPIEMRSIHDARNYGIEMIHQEISLFPSLSIAENLLIGHESLFSQGGFINRRKLREKTKEILARLTLGKSPDTLVSDLSVGEQQLVEIAKALLMDVRYLIMDEPTAALTDRETERLFEIIRSLKSSGVGIIYISHRMEELFAIVDTVTVLRDGEYIDTLRIKETTEDVLVSLMVGRSVTERYPKEIGNVGDEVLRLKEVSSRYVDGISLHIRAGEIVGIGGLMGSGRTEIARIIFGMDPLTKGELIWKGHVHTFHHPIDAIEKGVAFATEDRKQQGLILGASIRENLALPTLEKRSQLGFVKTQAEKSLVQSMITKLKIKAHSMEQAAGRLSGGNQQKVVLAKWLATEPSLFILDEPTRGIDVGAKQEIYRLMNQIAAEGNAILLISSDLPELLGMSDRVYVMREHTIAGELNRNEFDQDLFMKLATGGDTRDKSLV